MSEVLKLPLWKNCLEKMRAQGFGYGSSWPVDFFEGELRRKRDEQQFAFEMMALKQALEEEDGYYLESSESGKLWSIPAAAAHEDVAKSFEHKMRRYSVRSVAIRAATLTNASATLTDAERQKMEANLERASTRLVLLARQQSIVKKLKQQSPKLLK